MQSRSPTDADALHLDGNFKEVVIALCHALGLLP